MEFMVRKLLEEYEKWGLKINLEKTFNMGCGAKTKDLILEDQKACIRGCEEFKYLRLKIPKEDRQKYIKNRINNGRAVTAMLNSVLWNRKITRKNKLLIYNSIVKSTVIYGAGIWKFKQKFGIKTYVYGNVLSEEIGQMFKIRTREWGIGDLEWVDREG